MQWTQSRGSTNQFSKKGLLRGFGVLGCAKTFMTKRVSHECGSREGRVRQHLRVKKNDFLVLRANDVLQTFSKRARIDLIETEHVRSLSKTHLHPIPVDKVHQLEMCARGALLQFHMRPAVSGTTAYLEAKRHEPMCLDRSVFGFVDNSSLLCVLCGVLCVCVLFCLMRGSLGGFFGTEHHCQENDYVFVLFYSTKGRLNLDVSANFEQVAEDWKWTKVNFARIDVDKDSSRNMKGTISTLGAQVAIGQLAPGKRRHSPSFDAQNWTAASFLRPTALCLAQKQPGSQRVAFSLPRRVVPVNERFVFLVFFELSGHQALTHPLRGLIARSFSVVFCT